MDATIRAQIDKHLIAAQASFFRTIPKGTFEIMPNWVRGVSGVQIPTFNICMPLNSTSLNDDLLADTAAFFYSKNLVYAIEIIHDQVPQGPAYLTQLGYQPLPPQPAMYLSSLSPDLPLNPQVKIERVHSVPNHTAFYTTLHAVFDFDLNDVMRLFPVIQLNKSYSPTIRHYLAFINEQPAAAGTIICKEGVVSVLNLCTLDPYRYQSIATTLLYAMLKEAQRDEFHMATVYATPQAYHLLTKFGFKIYTQRQWFLPPGLDYGDAE